MTEFETLQGIPDLTDDTLIKKSSLPLLPSTSIQKIRVVQLFVSGVKVLKFKKPSSPDGRLAPSYFSNTQ